MSLSQEHYLNIMTNSVITTAEIKILQLLLKELNCDIIAPTDGVVIKKNVCYK